MYYFMLIELKMIKNLEKDVIIMPIPHHLLHQLSTKNTTNYFTDFDVL